MDTIDKICHSLDLLPEVAIMAWADLIMLANKKQHNPNYIGACVFDSARRHHQARTFEDVADALECDWTSVQTAWQELYENDDYFGVGG